MSNGSSLKGTGEAKTSKVLNVIHELKGNFKPSADAV